jgi:hypothetical protein
VASLRFHVQVNSTLGIEIAEKPIITQLLRTGRFGRELRGRAAMKISATVAGEVSSFFNREEWIA